MVMRTSLLLYLIVHCASYWNVRAVGTSCDPQDSDTECGKVVLKNERSMWKGVFAWIACWLEQIQYALDEREAKRLLKAQKRLQEVNQRIQIQLKQVEERDPTEYGGKYRKNKKYYLDKCAKVLNVANKVATYAEKCIKSLSGEKNKRCDKPDEVGFYVKQLDQDEADKLRKKHAKKLRGKKGQKEKKDSDKSLLERIAEKVRVEKAKKPKVVKSKKIISVKSEKPRYDRDSLVKKLIQCAEQKIMEHASEKAECIKNCKKRRKLCHEGCKRVAKQTVKEYVNYLNKSGKKKKKIVTKAKDKKKEKKKAPRKKKKKIVRKKMKLKKKSRKRKSNQ